MDKDIESQDLYTSGYPEIPEEQKDGVPGWPLGTQWEIKLTTVTVNHKGLHYRDATTRGNSGSPVYEMKDGRYVAHGVHINGIDKNHESNEAVRIDVDALMKAYRHKKKRLHGHQIRSDASGSSSSRSSTLDSFTSRSSTLGSPISGSPLQDPPLQDPQPQDPPLQDLQPQDPPLQDPPPQQNRKAPKDNHSEPPKLSWFKRLCKTVKSWFRKVRETVKRWFW